MAVPVHVHATVPVEASPDEVGRRLAADGPTIAARATATALEVVEPLAAVGRFRAPALPTVEGRPPSEGELGCLTVSWHGDEEATGWPTMTAWLVPTAAPTGTRLALLSTRRPGYDLSTNRVDKLSRDRLGRTAMRSFLRAAAHIVETGVVVDPASSRPSLVGVTAG